MSTPDPVHALNRLLVEALRGKTDAMVNYILADYATARDAILTPSSTYRFYLTEEGDPDYPGILDRQRPDLVATWGSPVYLESVKEALAGTEADILERTWEERHSA